MITLSVLNGPRTAIGDIMNVCLLMNNELSIPMKITRVVEEQMGDKYSYSVEVEDCLDVNEWNRLIKVFFFGYEYRQKEITRVLNHQEIK